MVNGWLGHFSWADVAHALEVIQSYSSSYGVPFYQVLIFYGLQFDVFIHTRNGIERRILSTFLFMEIFFVCSRRHRELRSLHIFVSSRKCKSFRFDASLDNSYLSHQKPHPKYTIPQKVTPQERCDAPKRQVSFPQGAMLQGYSCPIMPTVWPSICLCRIVHLS